MKVLSFDAKKGTAGLAVETLDDLWHLYNLIFQGDILYAKTSREIKGANEGARPSCGRRVWMTLGIRVADVAFDRSTNRLRVRGQILEAPERYQGLKGAYHTITLLPHSLLKLVKEKWPPYQLDRLRKASRAEGRPFIVVAADDEEACVAVVRRFDVDVKFEVAARLPGKREAGRRRGALQKYFEEVSRGLGEVWKSIRGPIAVVGPGFIKEELAAYVRKHPALRPPPRISLFFASTGGLAGVKEALRSGVLLRFFKESRLLQEASLVEKFLARLSTQGKTALYGVEDVENAARRGAVEDLMVVDTYLRGGSDEERLRLEEVMREVERKGGKVTILSSEHEGGEKILSFGGVAALLRYPLW
ncbi:mRNA surveillance protein pelota [Candidatus Hecatella orcuttiae]|jgi:protein pelota|uniref:mRNA surveillance protein pelota n=1 Tax=Candidatus Hecatella orcuttiae TaxID=1935119 RepID=UPI00286813F0|nr:mRNA surveillance protein pelota [Candidatus Hecatella orcuttiae]